MGIGESVTFGSGEYASRGVNLEVNHRNTYGHNGIGNFGGGECACRGVNLRSWEYIWE